MPPSIVYLGLTTERGPTTRYRFVQFQPYFRAVMIPTEMRPLLDDSYMEAESRTALPRMAARGRAFARALGHRLAQLRNIPRDAILVVEREVFPFAPPTFEQWLARRPGGYVLEFDDAQFEGLGRLRKFRRIVGMARHVIVGNEHLAEFARRFNANVHVVPTCVDTSRYPPHAKRRRAPIRIGWIGLPTNFRHLEAIAPVLAPLIERGAAQLVVCSGRAPTLNIPLEFVPWTLEDEGTVVASFDIGVMPLDDTPFSRGKCGLKLLQYMAAGVPAAASPVGVNTKIISESGGGLLAHDLGAWSSALERLSASASLREAMGEAGRAYVQQHYSLDVWGPRLVALYQSWLHQD